MVDGCWCMSILAIAILFVCLFVYQFKVTLLKNRWHCPFQLTPGCTVKHVGASAVANLRFPWSQVLNHAFKFYDPLWIERCGEIPFLKYKTTLAFSVLMLIDHFKAYQLVFIKIWTIFLSMHTQPQVTWIGHFWVVVNLIMKARLSAKLFIWKLVLFAYEWKQFSQYKLCT